MKLWIVHVTLVASAVVGSISADKCGQLESNAKNFPWNVGIYTADNNELKLICFGSIIKSNVILTAAHCFCDNLGGNLRNEPFYIVTGNLVKRINLNNPQSNIEKVTKTNIFINTQYNGLISFLYADIALVKLNKKLEFNRNIKPICVDWSSDVKQDDDFGKRATWDQTGVKILQQASLTYDDCINYVPPSFMPMITSDKFCVSSKGIKPWQEDGGSGFVFFSSEENSWFIKGVISRHETDKNEFSTVTNVNQHLNWISNICAKL